MRSPFPGMDPYLEPHWPGLHTQLAGLAVTELNRLLPDDLVARPEERLSIESEEQILSRAAAADVMVYQPDGPDMSEGGVTVTAPYKLVLDLEPITERFIRIIHADDARLITVIEFISPANKAGRGMEEYLRKRDELLAGGVHVVEIDLVRRGNWRKLLAPHICPAEAVAPYRITIRLGRRPAAYLVPVSIREPLPSVSIPLRPGDKELKLALQPLLDQAYENGRYGRTLDYSVPPDPPLEEEDAVWAGKLVKDRMRKQ